MHIFLFILDFLQINYNTCTTWMLQKCSFYCVTYGIMTHAIVSVFQPILDGTQVHLTYRC